MTSIKYIAILLLPFIVFGCKTKVSFTGASIEADVNTINIKYFDNRAPYVEDILSDYFTNTIRDKYESETRLSLLNSNNADLFLEGQIVTYDIKPATVNADEEADLNRLTIGVKVKFTNAKHPEKDFEQTFSDYEDYPSDADYDSEVQELIESISERIIDKIFLKTVADW